MRYDRNMENKWNPRQYELFKAQRAKPFHDLAGLVRPDGVHSFIDLGCGTGELTASLCQEWGAEGVGVDSSAAMLEKAKSFESLTMKFIQADIQNYEADRKYDVVFSNAALHWIGDHHAYFPKLFSWLAPRGQIAVQMPCNYDHPAHQVAFELARHFGIQEKPHSILPAEQYAEMFYNHGFQQQRCFIEVYAHPMASGEAVVEWTKGGLLTAYQQQLSPDDYRKFENLYRDEVLKVLGTGPCLFTFKRVLLWARKV